MSRSRSRSRSLVHGRSTRPRWSPSRQSRSRSYDRHMSRRIRSRSRSRSPVDRCRRRSRSRSHSPNIPPSRSGSEERYDKKHRKHSKKSEKKRHKQHKHKKDKVKELEVKDEETATASCATPEQVAGEKEVKEQSTSTTPADARSFFEQLQKQEAAKEPVGTVHARGLPAPVSATMFSTSDKWECSKAGCGNMNSKHAPSCNKCGAMKRMTEWR